MQSLTRVLRSASALWPFYLAIVVISTVVAGLGLISPFIVREATDTIVDFAKLLSLPQRYFDTQVTGTIIARLDRSIASVTQFIQSFSNNFLPMIIQIIAILIITSFYYWPLTLLLLALFPVYTWLTALTSKRWPVSYTHLTLPTKRIV